MTASGVPWRYRYTYLAGGVNTPNPWPTWQDPALPPGQYALDYMNQSRAAGYIPTLPYYQLLQSNPQTGLGESGQDWAHLNDPAVMNAYYRDFTLLMQKAGQYGGQVLVNVEPDLWGYLQQRAGGASAATLTASVASSGYGSAAGLPNSVQGFAYELLKLRDTYAPNAMLGIHASMWSSGRDIGSDTDPSLNAPAEADKTAAFLDSAGISSNPYGSTWDVLFNDVDDHDAGWWEAQGSNNASFTHWWDTGNLRFPNFARYLSWVAELHVRTGRPQVAWQVPVGNQYYLTMNNTCSHYQDNVAQYFIGHASDLYNAGLIAVLFGAGNGCQTTNEDGQHDGITNNNNVPTTDTAGGCNACNTHFSTVADDDGGFLRVFVGQYYAAPPPAQARGPYHPLPVPTRILDTRSSTRLGPQQTLDVAIPGIGPGAGAAVINVTVTNASARSFLTLYPAGQPMPTASNLNFGPGVQIANLTETALGAAGKVSVYNDQGWVDVIFDLQGWTSATPQPGTAGLFQPLATPQRLLDTRSGPGALGPGSTYDLQVSGRMGIPALGVAAVILNVTAVSGTQMSYLTVYPAGNPVPLASNVNFPAGRDLPNRVMAKLGSGGQVTIVNSQGSVNVVVDVAGYFTDGSDPAATGLLYSPLNPARLLDTRTSGSLGPLGTVDVAIPAGAAAALNVTATDASSGTFLALHPAGGSLPLVSDLNLGPGDTIPNFTVVRVGAGNAVAVFNDLGYVNVIADLAGYYS